MAHQERLIIQVPRGGAVERQLAEQPPSGDVVVTIGATDAEGRLEPPAGGEVVLSVASPEALSRESGEVRRVIERAGTGLEPLVLVVEAAEALRDDELKAVVDAAAHAPRAVILRVMGDA
jgi:hypothetical protein